MRRRRDFEPFAVPEGRVFQLACCDCGLVHDMVLVHRFGMIGVGAKRNHTETAARRAPKKGKRRK